MNPTHLYILFFLAAAATTNAIEHTMAKTRNQFLRFYILNKKHKILTAGDIIYQKTKSTYNYLLSKYHDANILYYSLSDSDRELIEAVINLHF